MPPLRYLSLVAAPRNLPAFDSRRLLEALREACADVAASGSVQFQPILPASENVLRQSLADPGHAPRILHLVAHAEARAAAHYVTLQFEGADGRSRALNARVLSTLLAPPSGPRCILLQSAAADGVPAMHAAAEQLAASGCGCVLTLPAMEPAAVRSLVVSLLRQWLQGRSPAEALDAAKIWAPPDAPLRTAVRSWGRQCQEPLLPAESQAPAAPRPHPVAPTVPRPAADPVTEELKRKRAAGAFDVFLCHNSADKPAVRQLALALKARGMLPWLDEWELPPGQPWQPHLESVLQHIGSAAVCIGATGTGPWQEQELYGFLREFTRRRCPVIPVLLPEAPSQPDLPLFLQAMTWVDLRTTHPDPMERLLWGITGRHPEA